MTDGQETLGKGSSKELDAILDRLSFDQKRFLIARQEYTSDKAAALSLGLRADLPYRWRQDGAPIDDALDLMTHDGVVMALHLRRKALAKAMAVKARGLDSDDQRVAQAAASELIEWELGKAMQRQEFSGQVTVVFDDITETD